jgi:hypothetical protein
VVLARYRHWPFRYSRGPNTATNRNSRWLFPGRRAGQPMHADALAALVDDLGIPTVAGRASAIRQHVLEMPAPVVADALGYHQVTTAKLAAQAGEPGAGTPPETTCGHHRAELHRELTAVEYANLPVSSPGTPQSTSRALSHHQPLAYH